MLSKKLGIKPGVRVLLAHAPATFAVDDLPDGVRVSRRRTRGVAYEVVAVFVRSHADLRRVEPLIEAIPKTGRLWVAWPRKAGALRGDVDEHAVRGAGLAAGLVDNKVAALTPDWSGLQFVYRLRDR